MPADEKEHSSVEADSEPLQPFEGLGGLQPISTFVEPSKAAVSTMEDEEDDVEASGRDSPLSTSSASQTVGILEVDFKDHHNLIIFDWDDTLLPSSYLASQGLHLDSPPEHADAIRDQLVKLENIVSSVLNLAMNFGCVCIITNAENGWVELSAKKFLPNLVPLLSKIPILSARSTFEPAYPNAPLQWKLYAFKHHISQLTANDQASRVHVLSFGDSHVEREAVFLATSDLINSTTKSIKFAERPSLSVLHRQLQLLNSCFRTIYQHPKSMDEGLFVHQL